MMENLNLTQKTLILCFSLTGIAGCTSQESTGSWAPYSWGLKEDRLYYWFLADDYPTYDKCIKAAKYISSRPNSSKNSSEPVGCGYSTNSFIDAVFNYYVHAEREHFQCIFESYNPKSTQPYTTFLKGYEIPKGAGECVWK